MRRALFALWPLPVLAMAAAVLTAAARADEKADAAELVRQGDALYARKQYDKAMEVYEAAIRQGPKSAAAYRGRADVLRMTGRFARAVQDYDQSIRLDDRSPLPYRGRADA